MPQLNALAEWLDVPTDGQGQADLGKLKAALGQHGVNSRGWRLYLDHGDAMFNPLLAAWPGKVATKIHAQHTAAWLCVLQACETDVLPPPELVASIAHWGVPSGHPANIPPQFLRAAWKATMAARYADEDADIQTFVTEEVVPLARWFFCSDAYKTIGPERLKAGWDSLKRSRRESVAEQVSKMCDADWAPVVQRYASGPYVLVGLHREAELTEEGEAMEHCVGEYGDRCRFEPLRIYSIRRKKCGTRVATLSVREEKPGCWNVDQVKGHANADVGKLLWPEIDMLLQLLNEASTSDIRLRQYLDAVRCAPRD